LDARFGARVILVNTSLCIGFLLKRETIGYFELFGQKMAQNHDLINLVIKLFAEENKAERNVVEGILIEFQRRPSFCEALQVREDIPSVVRLFVCS
jgi:hypothetical protein